MVKKFKFNLQSVLNLKEFKEELLKQDLCKLLGKLNKENKIFNVLMEELTKTKNKLDKELSGNIEGVKVIECNSYMEYLNSLITDQNKIIEAIKVVIEQKRAEILKNEIEKKVIEKLKGKQFSNYVKDINTKTQKNMDDMTIQRICFERRGLN
ncbi:MAG: flagellar export protein FliJ [Actinomycetota bacterium]|nr:flagellar export protein FliJ [Actinomycetota bacterium]